MNNVVIVLAEAFSILEDETVLQFLKSSKNAKMFFKMVLDPMELECSESVSPISIRSLIITISIIIAMKLY